MSDMQPITPLGGTSPRVDAHGPVTLTEVVDVARASLAARLGGETRTRALLQSVLGVTPPDPGCASFGAVGAFWMGPDQWMVQAPHDTDELLAQRLQEQAAGCASVTEQTDAWCQFDLTGEGLFDVFELLCPVDLRRARDGGAWRTGIEHLGCFVLRRSGRHISVLGPRSSASSLHHALLTAIRAAH